MPRHRRALPMASSRKTKGNNFILKNLRVGFFSSGRKITGKPFPGVPNNHLQAKHYETPIRLDNIAGCRFGTIDFTQAEQFQG